MTSGQMLRALGHGTRPAQIREFQRRYNAMGPRRRLDVSGLLDDATRKALETAYGLREVYALLGEGED